jgi:hypothetical protein
MPHRLLWKGNGIRVWKSGPFSSRPINPALEKLNIWCQLFRRTVALTNTRDPFGPDGQQTAKANGNTLRPDADSFFGEGDHALTPPKQQCDLNIPRGR